MTDDLRCKSFPPTSVMVLTVLALSGLYFASAAPALVATIRVCEFVDTDPQLPMRAWRILFGPAVFTIQRISVLERFYDWELGALGYPVP